MHAHTCTQTCTIMHTQAEGELLADVALLARSGVLFESSAPTREDGGPVGRIQSHTQEDKQTGGVTMTTQDQGRLENPGFGFLSPHCGDSEPPRWSDPKNRLLLIWGSSSPVVVSIYFHDISFSLRPRSHDPHRRV